MKIELDLKTRSHIANLLRKESMRARSNAEECGSRNERVRLEWQEEAQFNEVAALLIDDGEELPPPAPKENRPLIAQER